MSDEQPCPTYLVVDDSKLPAFMTRCSVFMAAGWTPIGGVSVTVDAGNWKHYFQAFTKEKP